MNDVQSAEPWQLPGISHESTLFIGTDRLRLRHALGLNGDRELLTVAAAEAATVQFERRFDLVVVMVCDAADDGEGRAMTHCAVQHLERGGHLVVVHEPIKPALCDGFGSADFHDLHTGQLQNEPIGSATMSVFRRGERITVHDLLYEARATIKRVTPGELLDRLRSATPPLVLDTRTPTDRGRFGVIPDAVHVPRTVVEWHLDPANGYLHPAMRSFDQQVVVVCNSGYSSSLAAANLVRIGFSDVADLIGGHTAWCAAGLPVESADHSHLDTPAT